MTVLQPSNLLKAYALSTVDSTGLSMLLGYPSRAAGCQKRLNTAYQENVSRLADGFGSPKIPVDAHRLAHGLRAT